MFIFGRRGVGRRCQMLGVRLARSVATFFASALGRSFVYQSGSYEPERRSTLPVLLPNLAVPPARGLLGSSEQAQVVPSAARTSSSSSWFTAARNWPLFGPAGTSLLGCQRAINSHLLVA